MIIQYPRDMKLSQYFQNMLLRRLPIYLAARCRSLSAVELYFVVFYSVSMAVSDAVEWACVATTVRGGLVEGRQRSVHSPTGPFHGMSDSASAADAGTQRTRYGILLTVNTHATVLLTVNTHTTVLTVNTHTTVLLRVNTHTTVLTVTHTLQYAQ